MIRLLTCISILLLSALTWPVFGQQIITTFAGGGPADGTSAMSVALGCPCFIAANASGSVYLTSAYRNRVFKVDLLGNISTVAGQDPGGFSGDGGPATSATLAGPAGIAFDTTGNLYIADTLNNRVRRVDVSGIISTVAGNGTAGYSGDGGPAVSAQLFSPTGVAIDSGGNLYIADFDNNRIRKVSPSGTISSAAGNGTGGFSGDGGPAINAQLLDPRGVTVQGKNLYIADAGNQRIRKVDGSGKISTVAGNGTAGYSGDGGPATSAELASPFQVTVHSGNLYIADIGNQRVRKVDTSGKISTVAGNGTVGYSGDGGPATSAMLAYPTSVSFDGSGNLYIADEYHHIRKVKPSGIISTSAGNGEASFSGDGGPASNAQFFAPYTVAADSNGNFYIADTGNQRIRKVDVSGNVSTVAGNGVQGFSGDGGPARNATFRYPYAVAVDGHGNLYIADTFNQRVRKVDTLGVISTVAGRGGAGYSGDGGPATKAKLRSPLGVAVDGSGNLYIADQGNHRVRKVDTSGIITTVAQFKNIFTVAVDSAGNVYFADASHYRLRKLDTSGVISIVAGNGTKGFSGDGGPATSAELSTLAGVAVDRAGNIYISDSTPTYQGPQPANDRVRRVEPSGIISTVAGTGMVGFSGDGGPAANAEVAFPDGLAVDNSGSLYITDAGNSRIRKVTAPPHAEADGGR